MSLAATLADAPCGAAPKVLVTDLDGTLLAGDRPARRHLLAALDRHPEIVLVFATGRSVSSVRAALRDPLVPAPRWIVADVGATVVDGRDLTPVGVLQARLRAGWPGSARVRAALRGFGGLTYQRGIGQAGRCSYVLAPDGLTPDLVTAVDALGCGWSYSEERYFDVLPRDASKGNALRALAGMLGWPESAMLVAGDSRNDLSLFELGARGLVVGGAEPQLRAAVADREDVRCHDLAGAGAIVATLRDLGWIHGETSTSTARVRPAARVVRRPVEPLVVAYHRPPLQWAPGEGWRAPSSPNGIVPTLRRVLRTSVDGTWVALAATQTSEHDVTALTGLRLSLVAATAAEWSAFVHRSCKEALWPVLMSEPARMRFDPAAWAVYRRVNERLARRIAATAAPRAIVWLHEYNLWLVPGMLRRLRDDVRIGLFHHTPFPPRPVFDTLPVAAEIRASLGRLDWAGFHTPTFAERFDDTLAGIVRTPRVGVHPLGVDHDAIGALARRLDGSVARLPGPLVLSVERLDYAKAPVEKVAAVATLLERRPDLRGRLRFRLVCPPPESGITAYASTLHALERRIAAVNARWSGGGWQPIEYVPRRLRFRDVVVCYLEADVLWIASREDGMNLTAKEFVAAQASTGRSGVLVLSRNAGATVELGAGAIVTDPSSARDLVDKLALALALPGAERRRRMDRLAAVVRRSSPQSWASAILAEIAAPPGRPPERCGVAAR